MDSLLKRGDAVKLDYFGRDIYGRYFGQDQSSLFLCADNPKVVVVTVDGNSFTTSDKFLQRLSGSELENFVLWEKRIIKDNPSLSIYGGMFSPKQEQEMSQ